MKKRMTLREFSQEIGVSHGTVSKALQTGTKYRLSPEKIAYIREQAEKLGFDIRKVKENRPRNAPVIGVICGTMLQYLGCHFFNGINDICCKAGVPIILECCDHDVAREKKAFRRMCAEHVDALIYWPAAKPIDEFFLRSLNKLEQGVLEHTPCVIIGDHSAIAGGYKIMYRSETAGREAAIRQLTMGCRKFLILRFNLTWQDDLQAETAYRNALRKNGVPARNIKTLKVDMNEPPEQFSAFKNVEGIWLNHLFLFYRYMPYIQNYTDLKRLHVDGIGYQEFFRGVRQICSPLYKMLNMGEFLSDICGSSGIKFCNLYSIGQKAAIKALELASNSDSDWAGEESCEWVSEEEEKKFHPPL